MYDLFILRAPSMRQQMTNNDHNLSSVYLVKRSGIIEAIVPDFIHNPGSLHIVLAIRPCRYGQCRSPSYAFLHLLCYIGLPSREELS